MHRALLAWTVVAAAPVPAAAGMLSVPKDYTPEKSWPVVVSTQSNPSPEVMKDTPYFLVHAGGQGAECTTKIREELLKLAGRYNIDPLRIYATSFSRGGHEILLQAAYHPHWFAAIAPVCNDLRSGPGLEHVKHLRTPTLLLHGQNDSLLQTGKALHERLKAAGTPVEFKTYPGGHSPDHVWNTDNKVWLDFFSRHKLDPYPKQITHLVAHKRYSRAYWADATLIKDAGGMNALFTVRVKEGNLIEVEANDQIASLDLFLTGKLVETDKSVKVVSGQKTLYSGPFAEKITVTFRNPEPYYQTRQEPLWERIEAIKRTANYAKPTTRPKAS